MPSCSRAAVSIRRTACCTERPTFRPSNAAACSIGRCPDAPTWRGALMSLPEVSLESAAADDVPARRRPPRPWKFVGTILWGAFAFGAMFAGQIAVTLWFLVRGDGPVDFAAFK